MKEDKILLEPDKQPKSDMIVLDVKPRIKRDGTQENLDLIVDGLKMEEVDSH